MIDGSAIVSCYADTAALLIMVMMLLLSERLRSRKDRGLAIFFRMCIVLIITCIMSFICHAMVRQPAPWCHTVAIACRTVWEWLAFLIIVLWTEYVIYKLYGDTKRFVNIKLFYLVPFAVYTLALFSNLFTGVIFTCDADNDFTTTWFYDLFVAIEGIIFLIGAIWVRYYDRNAEKIRFIHVAPMIIPVAVGVGVQFLLPYQTDVLGFAIGMLLLYFSMADELRFIDEDSGLYNSGLLTFIFDHAFGGKNQVRSALSVEVDGNLPAGFEILRETLQKEGDVIRLSKRRCLMFSSLDSRSELQLKSTYIEEAVNRFNTEHPNEEVRMTVHCRMRTGDEETFPFVRSVVEEKDAGDPVRGVVSMISELDQLDKDMKLAADIQNNMLPNVFPDRSEFELYAIMDPAREVGGDFYDFFLLDSDHLALVIADVSGKGIPAALFMMVSKTLIKNQLTEGCDPATALDRVNQQLCERNSSMMFDTVWLAILEISTGRGVACNAGHENPALRRAGGNFEMLKYKHGMVVGVNKNAKYENREFQLSSGDCIFVYTDGVPEATNAAKELFGEERLLNSLNKDPDAIPEDLIHRIHDDVFIFADYVPQFDDITMLCIKYHGPQTQLSDPPEPRQDQPQEQPPETAAEQE